MIMVFNSITAADDYNFGAQMTENGCRVFLPTNKAFKGIYLAKFLQMELWILFVFETIL